MESLSRSLPYFDGPGLKDYTLLLLNPSHKFETIDRTPL